MLGSWEGNAPLFPTETRKVANMRAAARSIVVTAGRPYAGARFVDDEVNRPPVMCCSDVVIPDIVASLLEMKVRRVKGARVEVQKDHFVARGARCTHHG